jgi:hypothetical protein
MLKTFLPIRLSVTTVERKEKTEKEHGSRTCHHTALNSSDQQQEEAAA